ncbi:ankyrin repeat-containing domain protein [Obelidium mucronatum]|nr:ankyrin repeat-containing domain protein [Obelidium mucronatum]
MALTTRNTGVASFPPELVEQTILHLPIDSTLIPLGLAAKHSLGFPIFASFSFARRHVVFQVKLSRSRSTIEFMNQAMFKVAVLPTFYQAAIYSQILCENISNKTEETDEEELEFAWRFRALGLTNNSRVMDILLESEFDPSVQNNRALRWAVASQCYSVTKTLLSSIRHSLIIDPSANNNEAIRTAALNGNAEITQLLLQDSRVDPTCQGNYPLVVAATHGHLRVLELLLQDKRVNPTTNDNNALVCAAMNDRIDCVRALIQSDKVDPSTNNNSFFISTIEHGLTESLQILLESGKLDPSWDSNVGILLACTLGREEIVNLLLKDPRVDPSSPASLCKHDNSCLYMASSNGHFGVVKRLLADSRVDPVADECRALRAAYLNGHMEVSKLIMMDRRVVAAGKDSTIARMAVIDGDLQVIQFMGSQNRIDPTEIALVKLAILRGRLDIVECLLADSRRVLSKSEKSDMVRWAEEGGKQDISAALRKKWRGADSVPKMVRLQMNWKATWTRITKRGDLISPAKGELTASSKGKLSRSSRPNILASAKELDDSPRPVKKKSLLDLKSQFLAKA